MSDPTKVERDAVERAEGKLDDAKKELKEKDDEIKALGEKIDGYARRTLPGLEELSNEKIEKLEDDAREEKRSLLAEKPGLIAARDRAQAQLEVAQDDLETKKAELAKEAEEVEPPLKRAKRKKVLTIQEIGAKYETNLYSVSKTAIDGHSSWFQYESGALPRSVKFFSRSVYKDLEIAMQDEEFALLTSTPGVGKTKTLKSWLFENAIKNKRCILSFENAVFCCDGGCLASFIIDPQPENILKLLKLFVDQQTTVYLDVPRNRKNDFLEKVISPSPSLCARQVIVASSPFKPIVDHFERSTQVSELPPPIFLMKMWEDEEFNDFLKNVPGYEDCNDFSEFDNYGYLPRIAIKLEGGVNDYVSACNELMGDFDKFQKSIDQNFVALKKNKLGLLTMPHHVFQLHPNSVKYQPGVMIPIKVPRVYWSRIASALNSEVQKGNDLAANMMVNIGYDLQNGDIFEQFIFLLFSKPGCFEGSVVDFDNNIVCGIGPFSRLDQIEDSEDLSTIISVDKTTVYKFAPGWPTIDGFCSSGWLQVTKGKRHSFAIGDGEKKGKSFYQVYKSMESKKSLNMNINQFIWVVPGYSSFPNAQSMTGGTADKRGELENVKQFKLVVSRDEFMKGFSR
eukprot:TRINITY_DN16_c0_g1_i10.p1 TRINITY_DN16_c0_g1~~TRINITY_DN16_c0_g1_i10.p1  ORF type:complete len:631 (-),score=134.36 TRINITY_DN16_c0_g1_i10:646-2517(-)